MTSSFYVPEMLNNVNDKIFFLEKFLMNLVSKQVPYSLYIYIHIYIYKIYFIFDGARSLLLHMGFL